MKNVTDLIPTQNEVALLILKDENKGLHETIDKLLAEIDVLRRGGVPKIQLNVSAAEETAITQIENINLISRLRDLTLEDTKRFEILVKTQKLLEAKPPLDPQFTNLNSMSEKDLLDVAESNDEQTQQERSETTSLA